MSVSVMLIRPTAVAAPVVRFTVKRVGLIAAGR